MRSYARPARHAAFALLVSAPLALSAGPARADGQAAPGAQAQASPERSSATPPPFAPRAVAPVPYRPSQPVPVEAPPAAQAPLALASAGSDVVHLRNGGIVRGTIVELLPNDHATVLLSTGQSAIIAWSGIERIERGALQEAAPPPVPPPATPPTFAAETPARRGPVVVVHIQSAHTVTLERRGGLGADAQCASPCDREMPLDDSYRVVGDGINASPWFNLEGRPGERIVLTVSPGRKAAFYAGGIIASGGAVVSLVGLTSLAAGANPRSPGLAASGRRGAELVGGLLTAGGVGMMVTGCYLLFTNLKSDSAQEVQPRAEPPQREATWREPEAAERAIPRAASVAALRGTF